MLLDRTLQSRQDDPADPMVDYELEAVVSYHLLEGDPQYREDDDNILAMRDYYLTDIAAGKKYIQLADGDNHNDLNPC